MASNNGLIALVTGNLILLSNPPDEIDFHLGAPFQYSALPVRLDYPMSPTIPVSYTQVNESSGKNSARSECPERIATDVCPTISSGTQATRAEHGLEAMDVRLLPCVTEPGV